MKDKSDYQLIQAYLKNANQAAFEILLNRYFAHTQKILYSSGMPSQDIADACQQVWVKIIQALPSYTDEGKFGAFVTTVTKNLCKDYWRGNKNQDYVSSMDDEDSYIDHDSALATSQSVESDYQNARAISALTDKLIPELSPELRTVFLLKHEAEYWDTKRPLSWSDLAVLFGVSRGQVVDYFVKARDTLVQVHHATKGPAVLAEEELGIFLVWTQSQRDTKKQNQTETRLAMLLGIPVNTFKTRYKRAREALANGLTAYLDT